MTQRDNNTHRRIQDGLVAETGDDVDHQVNIKEDVANGKYHWKGQ